MWHLILGSKSFSLEPNQPVGAARPPRVAGRKTSALFKHVDTWSWHVGCCKLVSPSGCVSRIAASQHDPRGSEQLSSLPVRPAVSGQKIVMRWRKRKGWVVEWGVLMGEEISPESAHSAAHIPGFPGFGLLFQFDAEADFLTTPTPLTHIHPPPPRLTPLPLSPSEPGTVSISMATPIDAPRPAERVRTRPSEGPLRRGLWEIWFMMPVVLLTNNFCSLSLRLSFCLSISLPLLLPSARDLPV